MSDLEARRELGFENEVWCHHERDGRACGCNVFTVYKDDNEKMTLVCHWGHKIPIEEARVR